MERNKQLTIALPILLGVAILIWLPHGQPPRKAPNHKPAGDSLVSHDEMVVLIRNVSLLPMDKETGAWGDRDPFDAGALEKQGPKSSHAPADLKNAAAYDLSGIFWNEDKPSAIINDSVVNVGSLIDSATVKKISRDQVVLSDGTGDTVLMLRKD